MNTKFDYEYFESMEEVVENAQNCEGVHSQQCAYSTFHNALTQICWGCRKIRSNLRKLD